MSEETVEEQPRCGIRCARVDRHGPCVRCVELGRKDLAWFPTATAELHARLARGEGQGEKVGGTKTPPLPLDVAKLDHKQHLYDVAAGWARLVIEERNAYGPRDWKLQTVVDWLGAWHDWACQQRWGDEYLAEVREAAHLARVMCRLYDERPSYIPDLRCRQCRLADMWREPGEDAIICHSCQAVLRGDEMRAALAERIALHAQAAG